MSTQLEWRDWFHGLADEDVEKLREFAECNNVRLRQLFYDLLRAEVERRKGAFH